MALETWLQLLADAEWVDLSHTLEEGIPAWPTHARFGRIPYAQQAWGDAANHNGLTLSEHSGTHVDAPCHFIPGAAAIHQLPPTALVGRAVTLDLRGLAGGQAVSLARLEAALQATGTTLRPGDVVLCHFGWHRHWALGAAGRPYTASWPGLSGEAAQRLAAAGVRAVGVDTLAVDAAGAAGDPAHHALLGCGVLILENLTQLDRLPPVSLFVALPLKIRDGTASPMRAVALIPRS